MILTKTVLTDVGGSYQKRYADLGYVIPKRKDLKGRMLTPKGTKIEVRIEDLPFGSNARIKYQCDKCGGIFETSYYSIFTRPNSQYVKSSTEEIFCVSCSNTVYRSGKDNSNYLHGSKRYPEYRCNAKKRGIEFNLSVEEFEKLIAQPCHYCGGYSSDYVENSRGNGVDRRDSLVGYTYNNCVPCCCKCNFVKNSMPYKEFLSYIKRVYERVKEYEI